MYNAISIPFNDEYPPKQVLIFCCLFYMYPYQISCNYDNLISHNHNLLKLIFDIYFIIIFDFGGIKDKRNELKEIFLTI